MMFLIILKEQMHWVSKLGGNIFSSIIFLYISKLSFTFVTAFYFTFAIFFTPPTINVHAFQQREKLPMSCPSCWQNWMWLIKINVVKSTFFFLPLKLKESWEKRGREMIWPSSATAFQPAHSCIYPPILTPHISAAMLLKEQDATRDGSWHSERPSLE